MTAEELIFSLQHVDSDYGAAVQDGKIIEATEYREVLDLSKRILGRYEALRPHGSARVDLTRFRDLVQARASFQAVRSLGQELVPRLTDELDVVPYPAEAPFLDRGRELFREDCAPCHGVAGGGDGPASPAMVPKPTSFRDARISLFSPHQVYNATCFGVAGTGMPAYRGALSPLEMWDLAFFVMTLRDGFDPSPPVEIIPITLQEVATRSDEELLKRLRASRPGAEASELDYYRVRLHRTVSPHPIESTAVEEGGLEVATSLERAFARVADRVFPSVVGVSTYQRDAASHVDRPGVPPQGGWREGAAEDRIYPGFHPTRSGAGFVISGNGDVLTRADLLTTSGSTARDRVIDVELPGNVHCRARVIGIEPTIDLAVLGIVAPVPLRSVIVGDSDDVRVGQWAIAVGDPSGPERTFAPGTIAARPERDCYQEHRTSTLFQSSAVIDATGLGGPLVNIRGEVVGLTIPGSGLPETPIESSRPVSALPINLVMTIYRALKVKESERSPWIGISVLDLSPRLRGRLQSTPLTGVYIDDVFEPSPASRIGIQAGDVLTKMDDHPILSVFDFQTWLYLLGIDAVVTIELVRDGTAMSKRVTIEQRPASAPTR